MGITPRNKVFNYISYYKKYKDKDVLNIILKDLYFI